MKVWSGKFAALQYAVLSGMNQPRNMEDVPAQEQHEREAVPLASGADADVTDDVDTELATALDDEADADILQADLDEPVLLDEDERVNEAMSTPAYQVVLETDLEDEPGAGNIHSPDMDAPNVPGEIDIEDLGEDALDAALPPDARLDRLEE